MGVGEHWRSLEFEGDKTEKTLRCFHRRQKNHTFRMSCTATSGQHTASFDGGQDRTHLLGPEHQERDQGHCAEISVSAPPPSGEARDGEETD